MVPQRLRVYFSRIKSDRSIGMVEKKETMKADSNAIILCQILGEKGMLTILVNSKQMLSLIRFVPYCLW